MTSETSARPGGVGYIDDTHEETPAPGLVPAAAVTTAPVATESGSSTEEEEDEDEGEDGELDGGDVDERSGVGSDELDYEFDDDEDWDAQGEDWDLATGDFTKQYNRLRQVQAAVGQSQGQGQGQAASSSSSSSRTMLPAQNRSRAAPVSGVALNPKVAAETHDKDKSDRATLEQVLDSRTRLVLTGLVNRDIIGKVNRCVSTGKEANVYHASPSSASPSTHLAVKVYRTSILAFRSRSTYMTGEHRFKGEYTSSKNPRKMVRVWAEKEFRNLRRLEQEGVRSPRAIEVKQNVLVMEYLGQGDKASPRLKDVELSPELAQDLYVELLVSVRKMFRECRLVHADLSEYNLLYHEGHISIIDVSQSVEEDHPRAFDFLRHDISNVEAFFAKAGAKTLGSKRAWEFITGKKHDNTEVAIRALLEEPHDPIDDAVFMASFIPRSLGEVYDPERDVEMLNAGRGDELIYAEMAGLAVKESQAEPPEPELAEVPEAGENATVAVSGSSDSEEEDGPARPRGFRHEDKDAKKERKKAVKEENREKRKTKMPKAEKQKLIRKSQR